MPTPHALPIHLSERQKAILNRLIRAANSPQSKVQRAKIICLAAEGKTNTALAAELDIPILRVSQWRKRWHQANLSSLEDKLTEKELQATIMEVLSDLPRPGTPPVFSAEQVAQILALACEKPEESEYPVTHWTHNLLAIEAVKRKIVKTISAGSIGNFLKGSRTEASSGAPMAQSSS